MIESDQTLAELHNENFGLGRVDIRLYELRLGLPELARF
jgi:hypothetical protein